MATLTLAQAQAALATQQAKLDQANAAFAKAVAAKQPASVLRSLQTNVNDAKAGVTAAQAQLAPLQQPAKPAQPAVDPRIALVNGMLGANGQAFGSPTGKTAAVTQGTGANAITFYPTPQGWVQTQVPGAQGYVTATQLPTLQQAQTTAVNTLQQQQAAQAAQQAAAAKAAADAAAAKAAADAAAVAAAQKAAQEAAAAKQVQIDTLVGQYSSATTPAQVDSITGQLLKLGYTPSNQTIADAKAAAQKIVTQQQTVDFNSKLSTATTKQQVTDLVNQAKAAGITLDPTQANTKIDLTAQIQTAQKQDDVNNLLARAQQAGIQLDPAVVNTVNAKFALAPEQYIDASTIDPSVLKDYGVKTSTVDGRAVLQTSNPNASGYVNPSELQKYQQLTAKIYATQQAQTNFTLPDAATAGRGQTVTSPNGLDTYQAVPADPITGTPAQWYKVSADGSTYTPVTNKGVATTAAPIARDAYFKQFDTAAQNIQTKQYNDYVASIPTTTVGSKTYQTQDPTVANYISPENLAFTQQQYQQQQQGYQQLVDQMKAVNPADAVYTGSSLVDPKTGAVYQKDYPDMPGYVAPGSAWAKLEQDLGAHVGYSANTYQQYQADSEAKRVENAYNAYQSTFQNSKQGDPAPVMSAKDLPAIGNGAKPMVAADTGITYYPTADGWKQSSDTTAANYQPANQIQMKLPEPQYQEGMEIYYSNVRGPDGTIYTPKWANPNTGEAGGYIQNSNPSAPGYVDQQTYNQIINQETKAGYAGMGYTNIDPLTGRQINTSNPYAPNYMSQEQYQANLNQYAQQQSAEREIFGIDDLGRSIDDFVNKTVGWETIATIAGSMLGGPLGASLANAAAGAVQGKSPGEILKSAALTYALAYGTEALANELGPALEEATSSAVDSGMLDPDVLAEATDEFAGAGYGDYIPDVVENYGSTTPVEPDFGFDFEPSPIAPEAPPSIYDVADDFGTPGDFTTPEYAVPEAGFGPVEPPITETPPSIYDNAVDYGTPVQPQAPTDLQSTGFSDSAPGTIYTNQATGAQEIVLDSGKTVNLADYQAAVDAGGPVSIDGMMQTGGSGVPGAGDAFRVEVTGAPYLEGNAPQGFTPPEGMRLATFEEANALSNAGGVATSMPDGSFAWVVPEGTLPEVVVTATREGLLTPEMIMGGAAVVGGAVALGGGAGAGGAVPTPSPTPTPAPVEPVPTPTPAPAEPTPTPAPAEPVPAQPTTPTQPVTPTEPVPTQPTPGPAPTEPVPTQPTPGPAPTPGPVTPEVPVTDITPTPVTPTEPLPPPEVPPGEVPVTDVTPTPVEPTPVEPTPVEPTPVEPTPTNPNEVPVIDKSVPYEGEWSNESVLERYLNKTITYGDVLKLVAAGMVLPSVLALLGPQPEAPGKRSYGPLAPINWGTGVGGLTEPGLNPGYLTFGGQPPAFYPTTSPVQSQYYWGLHPYMRTQADLGTYNQVPEAPLVPFGIRQAQQPFDVNAFIQRQGLTPQPTSGIPGYNNAPFTAYQTPQPVPVVNTAQYTAPAPTTMPAFTPINMNYTPVKPVPLDQIPKWAPGQTDLTQPIAPYTPTGQTAITTP